MKGLAKGLMTIALLAATTACDGSPTAGSALISADDGIAMARGSRLTFNSTQNYSTGNEQTASGSAGAIDFSGSVTTGTPCYDVSAAHQDGASDVTVTVTANDTGQICQQVITFNNYNGRVSGLAAGTYNFTVIHNVNGSSSTAFTGPVTVR